MRYLLDELSRVRMDAHAVEIKMERIFDCFDFNRHVISRDNVNDRKWPHWVSSDRYACVAYLWTKSPSGVLYCLAEEVQEIIIGDKA